MLTLPCLELKTYQVDRKILTTRTDCLLNKIANTIYIKKTSGKIISPMQNLFSHIWSFKIF